MPPLKAHSFARQGIKLNRNKCLKISFPRQGINLYSFIYSILLVSIISVYSLPGKLTSLLLSSIKLDALTGKSDTENFR